MKTLISMTMLASLVACVDGTDTVDPSASACEGGKCDDSTSSFACYEAGAEGDSYELANPSPELTTMLSKWKQAAANDTYVQNARAGLRIEKVFQTEPTLVFQATQTEDTPYCDGPSLASFVVFHDGTRFKWVHGRVEFPLDDSHFVVNTSAFITDKCHYGRSSLNPATFILLTEKGEVVDGQPMDRHVDFRRVSDDVVLATGKEASADNVNLAAPIVTIVIRPDGFFAPSEMPLSCAQYDGPIR